METSSNSPALYIPWRCLPLCMLARTIIGSTSSMTLREALPMTRNDARASAATSASVLDEKDAQVASAECDGTSVNAFGLISHNPSRNSLDPRFMIPVYPTCRSPKSPEAYRFHYQTTITSNVSMMILKYSQQRQGNGE